MHEILSYNEFFHYLNNLKSASPTAVKYCKNIFRNIKNININDDLINKTVELITGSRDSEDAKLGIESFLNKRNVNWYQNWHQDNE